MAERRASLKVVNPGLANEIQNNELKLQHTVTREGDTLNRVKLLGQINEVAGFQANVIEKPDPTLVRAQVRNAIESVVGYGQLNYNEMPADKTLNAAKVEYAIQKRSDVNGVRAANEQN